MPKVQFRFKYMIAAIIVCLLCVGAHSALAMDNKHCGKVLGESEEPILLKSDTEAEDGQFLSNSVIRFIQELKRENELAAWEQISEGRVRTLPSGAHYLKLSPIKGRRSFYYNGDVYVLPAQAMAPTPVPASSSGKHWIQHQIARYQNQLLAGALTVTLGSIAVVSGTYLYEHERIASVAHGGDIREELRTFMADLDEVRGEGRNIAIHDWVAAQSSLSPAELNFVLRNISYSDLEYYTHLEPYDAFFENMRLRGFGRYYGPRAGPMDAAVIELAIRRTQFPSDHDARLLIYRETMSRLRQSTDFWDELSPAAQTAIAGYFFSITVGPDATLEEIVSTSSQWDSLRVVLFNYWLVNRDQISVQEARYILDNMPLGAWFQASNVLVEINAQLGAFGIGHWRSSINTSLDIQVVHQVAIKTDLPALPDEHVRRELLERTMTILRNSRSWSTLGSEYRADLTELFAMIYLEIS